MPYFSEFYQIEVRDEIVKEFTNSRGEVDDMMAGLHEVRMRRAEKEFNLEALAKKAELFRMPKKGKPVDKPNIYVIDIMLGFVASTQPTDQTYQIISTATSVN